MSLYVYIQSDTIYSMYLYIEMHTYVCGYGRFSFMNLYHKISYTNVFLTQILCVIYRNLLTFSNYLSLSLKIYPSDCSCTLIAN